MQAILKSKHQKFCSLLQRIKDKLGVGDPVIDELENEMFDHYNSYMGKREELRRIADQYEESQKNIRARIKQLQRLQDDPKFLPLIPIEK